MNTIIVRVAGSNDVHLPVVKFTSSFLLQFSSFCLGVGRYSSVAKFVARQSSVFLTTKRWMTATELGDSCHCQTDSHPLRRWSKPAVNAAKKDDNNILPHAPTHTVYRWSQRRYQRLPGGCTPAAAAAAAAWVSTAATSGGIMQD